MQSLSDPEQLRDRDGVPFHEETHVVEPADFEATRDNTESHAVVGVTNDEGEVLLIDDGSHGWTLAAFDVEQGEDWASTAWRGAETVTGVSIDLDGPELARRIDVRSDGEEARTFSMYNVIFRASPMEGRPVAPEQALDDAGILDIGWFASVPDQQEGAVAEDIRLFLD